MELKRLLIKNNKILLKNPNGITKIIMQTSKEKPNQYIIDLINYYCPDWKYVHFIDSEIINFFINNPIKEFPNIIEKFNSFTKGEHKADLFRYYFLYLNGGIFLDSDAMFETNIDNIIKNYNCIFVNSFMTVKYIYNGFIATQPKNKIIYDALKHAYNTENNVLLNHYHYLCEELKNICNREKSKNIMFYYEEDKSYENYGGSIIVNNEKTILLSHYWHSKTIPKILKTKWNYYNKKEQDNFDYRILNIYNIPNSLFRVGPNSDGGYVIVNGLNYDLFISCGISDDIRFEDAFLDIYKDIKCFAFDGTINKIPEHRNNILWINKNIDFNITTQTTNLKDYIMDYNNIFLKMDIEGSEFNWIDSMTIEELNKFSQIVIEIHWPFDKYRSSMLQKLSETHYLVHIHGNNYCDKDISKNLPSGRTYDGCVIINNNELGLESIKLPEVFEITYVKKDIFKNIEINKIFKTFPTILDAPNNPKAKDIVFSIPI